MALTACRCSSGVARGLTEPGSTDPSSTDPDATEPDATEPGSTEPGSTDPALIDPGPAAPGLATDDVPAMNPVDAVAMLAVLQYLFFGGQVARARGRFAIAAPAQVAVDLWNGPGRNPSEAQELLAWMSANESEWRK